MRPVEVVKEVIAAQPNQRIRQRNVGVVPVDPLDRRGLFMSWQQQRGDRDAIPICRQPLAWN